MKKRLKGLVCWWLVLVMLVSTMVTPAMALPSNRIYIYTGTEPLKANDELYPYDQEGVSEGTQLSSLVPLGDGVTLTGWNLWEFDNINSGYVITDKLLTKDTDWTLSADDVEKYATGDYYAFEPIYSGQIAIYTDADEVAVDEFVGDYQVVSATTGVPVSEQASVIDVIDSSKTLEGWDIWSAGWSGYHSGTVWNERISEESADYTLSSKYFVTSDDLQYYLVPVYGAAPPHKHPICGAAHTDIGDHTGTCENVDWTAWDGTDMDEGEAGIQLNAGNYYLTKDVIVTSDTGGIHPVGNVALCLNGHTISCESGAAVTAAISFDNKDDCLTLTDCAGTGLVTRPADDYSITIWISAGKFEQYGGTIQATAADNQSTAIWNQNNGTFSQYGGTIESKKCTAIRSLNLSTVNLYGGTIEAAIAGINASETIVNLYGGNITAQYGLGAFDDTNVNLYNAVDIDGTTADIYVGTEGVITLSSEISKPAEPYSIVADFNTPFTSGWNTYMSSATISDYFIPYSSEYIIKKDATSGELVFDVKPTGYTVKFDANGGTCETASAETIDGKLATLPDATRVGYIFNGWFDAAEGENKITTETEFTDDTRIYAQWTAYEITQQPTVDNEYEVVVNPSANVAYTWHEITETPVTTENADIFSADGSSSYNQATGEWTCPVTGAGDYNEDYYYFTNLTLASGDIIRLTFSDEENQVFLLRGDRNNSDDYIYEYCSGTEVDVQINVDATYSLFVVNTDGTNTKTVKAKVIRIGEAISGQTTNKLTDGTDGTNYVAKITYPDGAVLTSEAVCYVSPSFEVTFDTNGGTNVSKQTVDNGGKVEEPATPTKTGYTFAGWYKDSELETAWDFDTDTVTEPTTLYAKWTANTNTPYVVNHWVQTLDAAINENAEKNETNYTLKEDENLTGTTDATFKANTKEIDGFKAPDKENITIAADGSTVHNYYYTRNKYNIVINTDEGVEELSGDGQYYYEQAVEISATLKSGYKWNEWLANETGYGSANISYSFNMPATALVLSPKTTPKAEVSINTDVQNYTYDKSAKAFEIRETDLTGFTVSYEQNGIAVTPINAGFYDVILSRAEDENYKEYSKTLVNGLIINKVIIDEPLIIDKLYNGFAQTADISDTEIYKVTENAGGTNVGAYDVVLTLKDSSNYKWSLEENSGATATRKFFITFTENTWNVEPQITGWTFGQEPSEPTFDAKFGEVVVEYKKASEEDSSYTADIPENAGDYKVKFTVEANTNFGSLSEILDLTITKAIPSLEAPTAQNDITYGVLLSTVGLSDGWTWLDGTAVPTVQNSGFVAYFTPADTANYDWTGIDGWNEAESRVEKTVSVTVTKADSSIAAAPTAILNLEYDGSAKALVNAGTANGGTMQYSLDGTTWSTDIPTRKDAGVYTIYYRVVGNSNYNDVAAQSIFVSIANADMSADITADGYNRVFDNQAHTISVDIPEGASVKYGTADGTYELDDAPQYTNVGTYTVYYKVEKANYNAVTGSADVVITAKDISNAEITLGEALTYTDSEQTRDFTVAPLDGLEIDYTVSGNTGKDAGVYTLTISGQGNFTGSKSVSWSIGKASQSAPETPVAVNETIKAKADGKITGVTSDMEYKLEGASEYIAISETEIANLAAGTYLVRYKENENHLAGADKQLVIADGAMITASFNSNEGTAVDSITCEYNQAITAPTEPTKENFVFAGWYKDAECFELWNFGNTLTEDITLYAKWNDKPVYSVSGKVTDGESGLGGITVTLKQGNTIIATTTTAADGSYSFITEDGLYNIVAEKEENDNSTIKTVKIEVIESANVNDVVFVATDINSELEIKPDTPQIVVGGLDEEAQTVSSSNGNADVTVKMTVESTEDITGSDSVEGQEQRQTEQKEIKKVSGNRYIQFIEINLTKSISGTESTKLEETSVLIEIIIPFEKSNKRNITVYRYHGSVAEKLGAGIGNANADGEYFEVKENHIVVYAKKFSTYAIGYDLPSSGGGGSSVTRYTVKFDTNGGSSVSSATVTKNAKVAEPKTPEKEGYTFNGWYIDEELTEKYDFESKVTKNFTLYAKWDKHDGEQPGTDTHNCPSLAFDDLDITKWYHFDTDYVIENGIFKGTTETTFEPDSAQTRAMMVTVLYRVEGEPAVNRSIPFADVDMGAYYANAVIWGQQNGIIKGYSETEFGPDDKITREQIAAIMHRYAQYKGYDVSVGENTNILSYDDFDSISEYAIASMQYACGSGLIKGKSESTLNPLDNATRAEIAAILHRFIEANK